MAYIDLDYYENTFKGTKVDPETFGTLSERASDLIDMATSFQLLGVDFENLSLITQSNVKKAVCVQVEYMVTQGGELSIHDSPLSSVAVGGFNYSEKPEVQVISPFVYEYLKPTGLLYRGVRTR